MNHWQFATEKHLGQFRLDGQPYITHPEAVADIARSFAIQSEVDYDLDILDSVAALHDVHEDCDVSLQELTQLFGNEVAEAVGSVSKIKGEPYWKLIKRAKANKYGRLVKEADLIHNLSDLKEGNLRQKYLFALAYLRDELHK